MLDKLRRRTPEEIQTQERRNKALSEARTVVKKLEKELSDQGSNGVLVYESDEIWLPPAVLARRTHVASGKEINLIWDLRVCSRSDANPHGFESRKACIGVLGDGTTIVSFSEPDDNGFSTKRWLEESSEYLSFTAVRRRLASEGSIQPQDRTLPTAEPTLEEEIRFAMREAKYISDGRHARV